MERRYRHRTEVVGKEGIARMLGKDARGMECQQQGSAEFRSLVVRSRAKAQAVETGSDHQRMNHRLRGGCGDRWHGLPPGSTLADAPDSPPKCRCNSPLSPARGHVARTLHVDSRIERGAKAQGGAFRHFWDSRTRECKTPAACPPSAATTYPAPARCQATCCPLPAAGAGAPVSAPVR